MSNIQNDQWIEAVRELIGDEEVAMELAGFSFGEYMDLTPEEAADRINEDIYNYYEGHHSAYSG